MVGVELDMVVTDSLAALELYENIFEIERVEATDLERGLNEVIFTLYGTRFHLLDENPEAMLIAPKEGDPQSQWVNVLVENIQDTYAAALAAGCTEIQEVIEVEDFGVSNAIFSDTFGYVWMLHQMHREVSFEERMRLYEEIYENTEE